MPLLIEAPPPPPDCATQVKLPAPSVLRTYPLVPPVILTVVTSPNVAEPAFAIRFPVPPAPTVKSVRTPTAPPTLP